jgi:S-adenosylmethionine decarboxylase
LNVIGTHLLIELRRCDEELLDNIRYIEEAMVGAANQAGATIVGRSFHKFDPRGVTGIIAIAESHLSIHTWPEHGYAAVDIFTCGTAFKPREAAGLIIDRLRCEVPTITEIERGPLVGAATAST